jgi:AcrR family transcriptional regulator
LNSAIPDATMLSVQLIQSALAILEEEGVAALSLKAVARHAGVSAMVPYRHFRDNDALLAAVATCGFDALTEQLYEADGSVTDDDTLVALALAYVRFSLANPPMFRLMFSGVSARDVPDFKAASDATYAVFEARIAAKVPPAEREVRALGHWSMVHGLATLFVDGWFAGRYVEPDEVARMVITAMLGGPVVGRGGG